MGETNQNDAMQTSSSGSIESSIQRFILVRTSLLPESEQQNNSNWA
jgi:hypothetical protein